MCEVSAPAAASPLGVVTFLFTDVEGSTRRWHGRTGSLSGPPSISKEAIWGDDR
jgi:hypothetical protein